MRVRVQNRTAVLVAISASAELRKVLRHDKRSCLPGTVLRCSINAADKSEQSPRLNDTSKQTGPLDAVFADGSQKGSPNEAEVSENAK